MHIDTEVLSALSSWKQQSQYSAPDNWIFDSPVQIGRLPFSHAGVWRAFRIAAADAGILHISSHSFRHTFSSWLDVVGDTSGAAEAPYAAHRHSNHDEVWSVSGREYASRVRKNRPLGTDSELTDL